MKRALSPTATNRHLISYIRSPKTEKVQTCPCLRLNTVNVEIFAQYIFSRISRRALNARKLDVSENYNCNRTNRNKQHMREKFNCANMSQRA